MSKEGKQAPQLSGGVGLGVAHPTSGAPRTSESASGGFQKDKIKFSFFFLNYYFLKHKHNRGADGSKMGQEGSRKRARTIRTSVKTLTAAPRAQLWHQWPGSSSAAARGESSASRLVLDWPAFSPGPSFVSPGLEEASQSAAKAVGAGGWKRYL